jgi:uncharacterized protein YegP (UPF0339 family)
MAAKFTIFLDRAKKYRFHLQATNGQIIAASEAYESKAACLNGIKSIRKNAPAAETVDATIPAETKAPAKKAAVKTTQTATAEPKKRGRKPKV